MKSLITLLFVVCFAPTLYANTLTINDAYARAMAPGAITSAVFGVIDNPSDKTVEIIRATTPAAGHVELHTVEMEGDVMKMRQVDKFTVPAHGALILKPGGFHIMLFDLVSPLATGQTIEVTITFKSGKTQTFRAPVKKVMHGMKHG
ncbi:copper chaperone PCu(A)C [Vibrio sp. SM6]|uniref:Copper chaperone PCu(A)C n=1 Tax=Vibrio agarilyticus TaxID=2726741 RepID=A0A7X8YFZ9_9VIBR|nr:copper chaperone PCu(A)C [Vibrio agarilyticus]NLS11842.1 copper chaperone PCu(A)C [Vibrio agarilyticus]